MIEFLGLSLPLLLISPFIFLVVLVLKDTLLMLVGSRGTMPSEHRVRIREAWQRYIARYVDIFICYILLIILAASGAVSERAADIMGRTMFLWPASLNIFLDVLCLNTFGTTPGKSLMGISLSGALKAIELRQLIKRSVLVWLRGMAIGFPIIFLITYYKGFKNLREYGVSSWDFDANIRVDCPNISWVRWILGLIILVLFYAMHILFAFFDWADRH